MMFPAIFNDNFFNELSRPTHTRAMATDIKEFEQGYELDIDLPGFKKENVQAMLRDGCLTISAESKSSASENNDGRYIRRERTSGTFTRSFYVGDKLTQDDISAKFEDGVLRILIPKQTAHPELPEKYLVSIE